MPWEAHISFRGGSAILDYATTGLITVRSNTFSSPNDPYSVTRDGFTFGMIGATYARESNLNTGLATRFQGAHRYNYQSGFCYGFRINLPGPGEYEVAAGLASQFTSVGNGNFYFKDGTTTFRTTSTGATTGNGTNIRDINNVLKTFAQWESDPGWVSRTFVNSYLQLEAVSDARIACLSIRQVGAVNYTRRRRSTMGAGIL